MFGPACAQTIRDGFTGAELSTTHWFRCERPESQFEIVQPTGQTLRALRTIVRAREAFAAIGLPGHSGCTNSSVQNSKSETPLESEPRLREGRGEGQPPEPERAHLPRRSYPLGMALEACPDIVDYARHGLSNWRDFLAHPPRGSLHGSPFVFGGSARGAWWRRRHGHRSESSMEMFSPPQKTVEMPTAERVRPRPEALLQQIRDGSASELNNGAGRSCFRRCASGSRTTSANSSGLNSGTF